MAFAKVLIGLGKGKKKYDKREDLKKKEAKREIERAFRDRKRCSSTVRLQDIYN